MNKEYAIYPFKYMNITQRHDQGTHIPNWQNSTNYSDLPWDEAMQDGGRSYFEPQNDFIIEEILGLGNNITNTVRLRSINKLYIPYKEEPDYLYLTLSHMDENNLKELYVGQILGKNNKVLLEGTDGFATGNHFHITANLGRYYGFLQNSNGAWCFTYQESLLPNEAFYYDNKYTNIVNSANYTFKTKPTDVIKIGTPTIRDTTQNQIEILSDEVYCRKTPELNGEIIGYISKGIYNCKEVIKIDDYTWYNIDLGWVSYDGNSIIYYAKKENIKNKNNIFLKFIRTIFKVISNFISIVRKHVIR